MRTPPSPRAAGVDDIAVYVPRHFLPVEALARARGIAPAKLTEGLGLAAMALPDTFEDTATMAANAVRELMERHGLAPGEIGRIYLGTESALDGAKPTSTYVLEALRGYYAPEHGDDCLTRCDVVDLTFACIGAVDALLATVDWVRAGEGRIGIVVASDVAKYELGSTGEYTQGAGAVALLVRESPGMLSVLPEVGVATRGVHDFFKPVRYVTKSALVEEVAAYANAELDADAVVAAAERNLPRRGVLDATDERIGLYRVTPTFDGPYSNLNYRRRVREAYAHYREQTERGDDVQPLFAWSRIVMHLPYAAHGRRMLMDLFVTELQRRGEWADIAEASRLGAAPAEGDFASPEEFEAAWASYLRAVGKTPAYRSFAAEQLGGSADASSLVGNVYAGSVFLALASVLARAAEAGEQLAGKSLGVIAYGSGSKAKVLGLAVRGRWEERIKRWRLFERLAAREEVDYDAYERLHRGRLSGPLREPSGSFALDRIGHEPNKEGARYYRWVG